MLEADDLSLAYDDRVIVDGLSLTIPEGLVTVIVGANACGKSTLLRGLARLLRPRAGHVVLDGQDIHRLPTREVATRLGILPQQPIAPEGITVADLVARGRHPHQRWFRQFSPADEAAVAAALEATGTADLAERAVDELSGGQRQRVWIALALAQETPLLLLDEPTTFLDLAHQVEVLDLLAELNREEGRTIVLVLHDLNMACRYAHHLVVMCDGAVVAQGPPGEITTAELVADVFGLAAHVIDDPLTGTPLVLPVPSRDDGAVSNWKRWLKYAKARVDSMVRSADSELDRKEAELDERKRDKPWLGDDKASPSFEDVKARIDHDRPAAAKPDSGDAAFDLAKQQKAADDRLKDIRDSLGLDPDGTTPPKK